MIAKAELFTWVLIGLLAVLLVCVLVLLRFVAVWVQALMGGVPIGLFELVGMRLRGGDPVVVLRALLAGKQAGLALDRAELERHHLAGGKVLDVVQALIVANRAGTGLDFHALATANLAGQDLMATVRAAPRKEGAVVPATPPRP